MVNTAFPFDEKFYITEINIFSKIVVFACIISGKVVRDKRQFRPFYEKRCVGFMVMSLINIIH